MQDHSSANPKRHLVSRMLLRLVSLACLVLTVFWILYANLGCIGTWDSLNTFAIKLEPVFFRVERPGQSGSVRAELLWAGEPDRLEAETWAIVGAVPGILSRASVSPPAGSTYTNLNLTCSSNVEALSPDSPWVASGDSAPTIGIKARFVDPVWKSISEGEEVIIARTAYVPIRFGSPRMTARLLEFTPDRFAEIRVDVENPFEGWQYSAGLELVFLEKNGARSSIDGVEEAIAPAGKTIPYHVGVDYVKAAIRVTLRIRNGSSTFRVTKVNIPLPPLPVGS